MKTLKFVTVMMIAAACTTAFTSCKKDDDDNKRTECRIINAAISGGSAFAITYNSDGTIAMITNDGSVTTYSYSGNTVTSVMRSAGVFQSRNIVINNSEGLAISIRTENDEAGTIWSSQIMEYNGSELTKMTQTSSSGGTPSVVTYSWSNGNLISANSSSGATVLEYFTDKPRQSGDYLLLSQTVEGYEIYRTKNLVKSIISSGSSTSFTYQFGSDGNISSVSAITNSTASVVSYTRQCD